MKSVPNSANIFRNPFSFNMVFGSLVARQAHNLKAVGSNPTPATIRRPPVLVEDWGFSIFYPSHFLSSETASANGWLMEAKNCSPDSCHCGTHFPNIPPFLAEMWSDFFKAIKLVVHPSGDKK